ncbi:BPL-N domain-containing protein [Humisphaera borealis]|uniref:Biotin-protein ligase N-terminal domain-containing protein n=1 Tax=Humisphaera borealis TaxID=2807512 RepID=A0A7M2X073_9BACT|nr:BPL-N domain-containing protein [Humisphaera borealis]QOV91158.1 hypothetical protein IPV69_07310 [Humisphaera borealis]
MSSADRADYERNKAWQRQRTADATLSQSAPAAPPDVGVYIDAGVWHLGARSIVEAVESSGVRCRLLDHSDLSPGGLQGLRAVIFPGGWAPLQRDVNSPAAWTEIRRFVADGGRYIGVCAGAYLASTSVTWYGQSYRYPLNLFDGNADGPLRGLSPYPTPGGVRLSVTEAGRERGLAALGEADVYYNGGSCFVGRGTGENAMTTLATYPDGSAAVITQRLGQGEIVLIGAHPERPSPAIAGPASPVPAHAITFYGSLVKR